MSFSVRMTRDDVCLWLKQNRVSEKDVQKFKGKHVLISVYAIKNIHVLYVLLLIYSIEILI